MQSELIFLLKPWKVLSAGSAKFFEQELLRELEPHHPLYKLPLRAVAITVESDDVLYRLDDERFVQVHLTYKPHEQPGWPAFRVFETITEWMTAIMLPEHINRFDLY
jgi:hypothetical protein